MEAPGHKTKSVFERYNIVNEENLQMASRKQYQYLEAQNGYNQGVSHKKRGQPWQLTP